ncbi:MAG: hypothetical protein WCT49_02010 [Candidatus Paceibacterota bacterium]
MNKINTNITTSGGNPKKGILFEKTPVRRIITGKNAINPMTHCNIFFIFIYS